MKTAIVYYSMSGNTEYAARVIADGIGADLIRIEPEKAYPDSGFRKFLWGGKSAVMGDKPALKPYEFDAVEYGRIVFGTPIWASNFAPPIRSFVAENKEALGGKRFAFFSCSAGGDAKKAETKLAALLGIDGFEATANFIDPKDKKTAESDAAVSGFCLALKESCRAG